MVRTETKTVSADEYRIDPELEPDLSHIETEDDTPLDNVIAERQHRLLVDALYSGWKTEEPFVAMTNVGLFYAVKKPPIVPDMLLSMGVTPPPHLRDYAEKRNRAYFIWEYGKPPDLVVEVVSNFKGGELGEKLTKYASLGIEYYVVYDPIEEYGQPPLRPFRRRFQDYSPMEEAVFPELGLRLGMWEGTYQGITGEWLRWFTLDGDLIVNAEELAVLLDEERNISSRVQKELLEERKRANQVQKRFTQAQQKAEQERQKAEQERQKAEQERQKAEQERQKAEIADKRASDAEARAEALAAKLRAMGIEA